MKKFLLFINIIVVTCNVYAVSGPKIAISADSTRHDNGSPVTIYSGDVLLTHGNLQINGDAAVFPEQHGHYQRLIISVKGSPARFKLTVTGQTLLYGASQLIAYDTKANILRLTQDAALYIANQAISGHEIDYDLNNNSYKVVVK